MRPRPHPCRPLTPRLDTGEAGTASVLPELAPLLHSPNPDVQGTAHDAMWAIFCRHRCCRGVYGGGRGTALLRCAGDPCAALAGAVGAVHGFLAGIRA